jgi:hypothetical protein
MAVFKQLLVSNEMMETLVTEMGVQALVKLNLDIHVWEIPLNAIVEEMVS